MPEQPSTRHYIPSTGGEQERACCHEGPWHVHTAAQGTCCHKHRELEQQERADFQRDREFAEGLEADGSAPDYLREFAQAFLDCDNARQWLEDEIGRMVPYEDFAALENTAEAAETRLQAAEKDLERLSDSNCRLGKELTSPQARLQAAEEVLREMTAGYDNPNRDYQAAFDAVCEIEWGDAQRELLRLTGIAYAALDKLQTEGL